MSSFRRYGGLHFSATNNITRSYMSNSEQFNVNDYLGQNNSKEVVMGNIDMSGNSIMHIDTIYFQDGTSTNTAVQGQQGPQGLPGATAYSLWENSNTIPGSIYYSNGNVGINTNSPDHTLDINGNERILLSSYTTNNPGNIALHITEPTENNILKFGLSMGQGNYNNITNNNDQILLWSNNNSVHTNNGLSICPWYNGTCGLRIDPSNNCISINTSYWDSTGTNNSLFVTGNTKVTNTITAQQIIGTNGVTVGSDYRIKDDIKPLNDTYNVDNINPIEFIYKETGQESIGVLAHELQEIFPFLVTGNKDGTEIQTVNYIGLISILIKEVQELKRRIKTLEIKLN